MTTLAETPPKQDGGFLNRAWRRLARQRNEAATPSHNRPRRPQRRDDQEFLPAALELLERPPSPVSTALMLFICLIVVSGIAWAWFSHLDIIATGSGKVQPSGRVKTVQTFEAGRVRAILAQNGTLVRAGEPLVELESDDAAEDVRALSAALASAQAEILRRGANIATAKASELSLEPVDWPSAIPDSIRSREQDVRRGEVAGLAAQLASIAGQREQKKAELARLSGSIEAISSLIAIQTERVDMRAQLVDSRSGSRSAVLDASETRGQQIVNLASMSGQSREAERALAVLDLEERRVRAVFVGEQSVKRGETERQIDELGARLAKARLRLERTVLRSPVDGAVQASSMTSIGQVLTAGQEAMRVVPSESVLEFEVYMPNRDIGFIKVGQEATIKVEAFPFTRYGAIPAHVVRIASDAVPEADARQMESDPTKGREIQQIAGAQRVQGLVFAVTLATDRRSITVDGSERELIPGMAVTAELKTGKRRVIDYVFAPLVEVTSRAARER